MQQRSSLAKSFGILVLAGALFYGIVVALNPWSFHIGGRWTPLLTWEGSGKLVTKGGSYPLYVTFSPSRHSGRLHLDGLPPTGGVEGSGWLCTAPGVTQSLNLSGTIYGGWQSTENSLMVFRLLEKRKALDGGLPRGYFSLYGRWRGRELVMEDRGESADTFRSG